MYIWEKNAAFRRVGGRPRKALIYNRKINTKMVVEENGKPYLRNSS